MLLLFILSHGSNDGIILTDYENEFFTTTEVLTNLKSLQSFQNCLKLVFFGVGINLLMCFVFILILFDQQPCRGSILDKAFTEKSTALDITGNENSCRVSSIPNENNFVIVFATVESKPLTMNITA